MNNYQPNNYMNQNYGIFGMNPMQSQMQRYQQQMEQQYNQYPQQSQPIYKQVMGLQGKSVDSIDVVKAMDIPLDGTISYFPLTDGSAIVTKQLQADGSSKTIIYKPIEVDDKEAKPKYITNEQLDEAIKKIDNKDLKEEIKTIKRQIKDITNDIRDLGEDIRERKE